MKIMSHEFRLSRLSRPRQPRPDAIRDRNGRLAGPWGALAAILRDGLAAIALALVVFNLAQHVAVALDAGVTPAAAPTPRPEKHEADMPVEPKHRALTAHLSQRYRIAPDAAREMVRTAHLAGDQVGLEPLLVLAVIAVESSFDPNVVSHAGAEGLMQVVPKYHEDKLEEHGGSGAVRDPMINILVGTRILEQYIRRTGSLEAGLQRYNGALSDGSGRYSRKVLAERERLRAIVDESERTRAVF